MSLREATEGARGASDFLHETQFKSASLDLRKKVHVVDRNIRERRRVRKRVSEREGRKERSAEFLLLAKVRRNSFSVRLTSGSLA